MNLSFQQASPPTLSEMPRSRADFRSTQRGVVLIIAMVLLIVISILAVTSMRNSASTEALAGNVRTTELAAQAAEIALRHCEQSVIEILSVAAGATPSYATTITVANIQPVTTPPNWQNTSIWDSTSAAVLAIPSSAMGGTVTFKRPPECMIENLPVILAGGTTVNSTASYVVTARGFGPEVAAADAAHSRPAGSEVWLQSHLELK
jgi:type IV pilus assembly protein PilX